LIECISRRSWMPLCCEEYSAEKIKDCRLKDYRLHEPALITQRCIREGYVSDTPR
jgi:hypothetical protein